MDERHAQRILAQALLENRAAEFMECLFEGGSATIDGRTGRLVLVNGVMLQGLASDL